MYSFSDVLPGMLKHTELPASLAYVFIGSLLFWSHWKCHSSFSCSLFVGCWCSKPYCTFINKMIVSRQYSPSGPAWFGKSFSAQSAWSQFLLPFYTMVFSLGLFFLILACSILHLVLLRWCTLVWGIQGLRP